MPRQYFAPFAYMNLWEEIEDAHQERDVAEHGDRDDALLEIEERSDAIIDHGHEHDREEPARDAEAHEEVGLHEPPPVAVEPPHDRSDGEHDQQESYRLYTSPWFQPRHDDISLELICGYFLVLLVDGYEVIRRKTTAPRPGRRTNAQSARLHTRSPSSRHESSRLSGRVEMAAISTLDYPDRWFYRFQYCHLEVGEILRCDDAHGDDTLGATTVTSPTATIPHSSPEYRLPRRPVPERNRTHYGDTRG